MFFSDELPTYQVELICNEANTTTVKNLAFSSFPRTFLDIKKSVEKFFSIPVCVQTLLYQSSKVRDVDDLSSSYIRSGDVIQVVYPIEGECEKVAEVVAWLRELANVFRTHAILNEMGSGKVLFELDDLGYHKYGGLLTGENTELARDLSLNLLFPWSSKSKYINKLHLDSLDVVELVMLVYKSIQHARLSNYSMFRGDFLECVCALFVANFTQTFPLRKRIVQHGGLNHCISTFLMTDAGNVAQSDAIEVSLYAICK